MRYAKGTFTTVPNREALRGLDPQTQVLFMWLCSYANDDGTCYPSIETLKNDCGFGSNRTVHSRIKKLVEMGFLYCERREIKGDRNMPNLYQIMLAELGEVGAGGAPTRVQEVQEVGAGGAPRVGAPSAQELKPHNNSTHLTKVATKSQTPKEKCELFFSGVEALKMKLPADDTRQLLAEIAERVNVDRATMWSEVQVFTNYWTEREQNGRRQRWQMEKTFEVERRLSTWLRRSHGNTHVTTQKPQSKYKVTMV